MEKGSEKRKADHPVHRLILDRWSPRAMSGEALAEEEVLTLIEAARWAPSSSNNQPWRILYGRRDGEHWETFLDLLVDANKVWAQHAAVLFVFVSKTTFDSNGKPAPTHSYDTGAAWENLALQATASGWCAHGMAGFDYDRAREILGIPEGYQVEAMAAVGKPGDPASLPEKLRERETPSGRKPLAEISAEGKFAW